MSQAEIDYEVSSRLRDIDEMVRSGRITVERAAELRRQKAEWKRKAECGYFDRKARSQNW